MKISYVIPCYNSSKTITGVVHEIQKKMGQMSGFEYEVILVNDASSDGTFQVIRNLCEEDPRVRGIGFSKNFGQHAALMAGFRQMSGDIAVCLDDDGQTPASEADRLVTGILEGYDVVYAKYEHKRHSVFRNLGSRMNRKMAESLLGKPKELYVSSYFAVRRFIVEEIKKYDNPYPYVIGLILRTTKNIGNVVVPHRKRTEGKSGYSLWKLAALWINGFTSFSVKPLRLATVFGAVVSAAGFVYAVWTVIKKFMNPSVPVGWSSTIAAILIIGGAVLLELGIIGEYIGRMYICMNHSPQYVVKEGINLQEDCPDDNKRKIF